MPVSIEITRTKRVLHRIDDELAICMIESGLARQWTPPAKPQPEPRWALRTAEIDQRVVGLTLTAGREVFNVGGPADQILAACERALAGRKLPLPSPELIAQYAQLTGTPLDPDVVQEQRRLRQQRDEEAAREQNKLSIPEVAR